MSQAETANIVSAGSTEDAQQIENMRTAIKTRTAGEDIAEMDEKENDTFLSYVANDMNSVDLPFFYVSELIDVILEGFKLLLNSLRSLERY